MNITLTGRQFLGVVLVALVSLASGAYLGHTVWYYATGDPNHPGGYCLQVDPRYLPDFVKQYIPPEYLNGSWIGWICRR